jgi:flagellin
LRINGAADDAAGLAISQRMTAQINGLNQAARNAADATSLSQTAEGALSEVTNNLQRIRELAVQSANATNSSQDRTALQAEVTELMAEINRVSNDTKFNGVNLLNGSFSGQTFQVGANASEVVTLTGIASSRTADLGTFNGIQTTGVVFGVASDTASAKTAVIDGNTFQLGSVKDDAKELANALNASGLGFVASANATARAGAAQNTTGSANETSTITINGITSGVVTSVANKAADRSAMVDAINAISGQTGVAATNTGAVISLAAADGRNITTSGATAGGAFVITDFGLAAAATTGATMEITLKTTAGGTTLIDGVADDTADTGPFNATANATTGSALSAGTVTTRAGSTSMITAVDAALDAVNSSRATLGAIQNRFESIVNSVLIASENQSAARSRIVDADFAAETASLTRGQILQQAGVAVLAQANAAPQNVLALLQ